MCPRRDIASKFSDLGVIALSTVTEIFCIDNGNSLFYRRKYECGAQNQYFISRCQYNRRSNQTYILGEEIRKEIVATIDGKDFMFSI